MSCHRTTILHVLAAVSVVAMSSLLGGCALTVDHIVLEYPTANKSVSPPPAPVVLPKADGITVQVQTRDSRSKPNQVSAKKNGYGMEMAAIVSDVPPADLLSATLRKELAARGFAIGDGAAVTVDADIQRFWNDFKLGFFAGDADAELLFNVTVKRRDGSVAFSRAYAGTGREPNIQISGGNNAKAALERAFQDGVVKLLSDTDFTDVLFTAAGANAPPR